MKVSSFNDKDLLINLRTLQQNVCVFHSSTSAFCAAYNKPLSPPLQLLQFPNATDLDGIGNEDNETEDVSQDNDDKEKNKEITENLAEEEHDSF